MSIEEITPEGSVAPVYIDTDAPETFAPEAPPSPTPQEIVDSLRHAEYVKPGGADSLFMKWRAGEGTEQAWLDERERVRLLYPDPEE